jgi:organic hydroperoxide reductase OsmC/OhrA
MHDVHRFACHTIWTGAARGATRDYAGYSREHEIHVEGKPTLRGSAAPVFRGDAALHNPEDLLVAALSACHLLSYLAFAARAGLAVEAYEDHATGTMEEVEGRIRFTKVVLHPEVRLAPGADADAARALHERAHHACFIASSVNFPVENEPIVTVRSA